VSAGRSRGKSGGEVTRLEKARRYLSERVDPLMSEIINVLLLEQPGDAETAILEFLRAKQAGTHRPKERSGPRDTSRAAVLRDRQYMARSVQPVLEKLMRRVVEEQPDDVLGHFVAQLSRQASSDKRKSTKQASAVRPAQEPAAPVFTPPPEPSNTACGALFRMLDEDGAGAMVGAEVVRRMASLRAVGVPLDSTAQAFWACVVVDTDASLDRNAFVAVMKKAAACAAAWMPDGSERPSLAAIAPAPVVPAATSPAGTTPSTAPALEQPVVAQPAGACGVREGQAVKVNYRKSGNFYPGKVAKDNGDGTFDIAYDDGDSEAKVTPDRILDANGEAIPFAVPSGPAAAAAAIEVGTRVQCKFRGKGNFYPGCIASVLGGGTFSVMYDDGDSEKSAPLKDLKLLDDAGGPKPFPGSALDAGSGPAEAKAADIAPVVALIGLGGAGKSTMLRAMGGDPEPKPRPTTGFSQKKLAFDLGKEQASVHWYDLPGSWTSKWEGYLVEAHALAYVVDAASDADAFERATAVFRETVGLDGDATTGCARVAEGKPLLVIANKQDEAGARSAAEVATALGLAGGAEPKSNKYRVVGCSCHPVKAGGTFDPVLEAALEWLLGAVNKRFVELSGRVKEDQDAAEAAREAEKIDRHRRVMTKVLKEKAFPTEGAPLETFSEVDGFEFLAMELLIHDPQDAAKTRTAEDHWGLGPEGRRVARLVGFQKMAMIMCADMINPEAKKTKTTHSWAEVTAYVMACREEAGLARDID